MDVLVCFFEVREYLELAIHILYVLVRWEETGKPGGNMQRNYADSNMN